MGPARIVDTRGVPERGRGRQSDEGGTLFVVGTPIGNLGELSARARAVLAAVDHIACEDSRVAGRLKGLAGSTARLTSYHDHNERQRTPRFLRRLLAGEDVALVADAGTPMISDPGYRLVRAARESGIRVRAVAGPSAVTAALSVSGLPTNVFTFFGFPPPKGGRRERFLDRSVLAPGSLVFFEAPRRVPGLLAALAARVGPREASVSREMTKMHEEHWFGPLRELADRAAREPLRGEVTLVIAPAPRKRTPSSDPRGTPRSA